MNILNLQKEILKREEYLFINNKKLDIKTRKEIIRSIIELSQLYNNICNIKKYVEELN